MSGRQSNRRRPVAASSAQLAQDQVALFLALGGGWESSHAQSHAAPGQAHAVPGQPAQAVR